MRLVSVLFAISLFALSACKDDTQSGDTLGKFEITIDGKATEIVSHTGPANRHSGIMVVSSGSYKILIIEGAAGIQDDGQPVLPLLSVTIISDASGGNFTLDSVHYTLEEKGNVYASDGNTGQQTLGNLVLDDGKISFDLSVVLVPHTPDGARRKVIEDVAPIHIEGKFSGAKTFAGIND